MESLGIRIYGDEILRARSSEVERFDPELERFIAKMVETMIVEDGVGLAAPQVGVSRRIAVVNPEPYNPDTLLTMVNPEIRRRSDEVDTLEEGCLSVPGIRGKVERPVEVDVEYLDGLGRKRSIRAEGLLARIIQHEIDHLDGILFIDRLSFGKRTLLKGKLRELARRGKRE